MTSPISIHRFTRSLRHAVRGLRTASEEHSFRVHVLAALAVTVILFLVDLSAVELAVIIILMANVLMLELVNTVVERFAGLLEPRVHPYVGVIKDLMAASVLIMSVAALLIALLIIVPAIFN